MIEIKEVILKAGSKFILNNISAMFEPNAMNFIIGPNGAGKSSLMKVMSGEISPNFGDVLINKQSISQFKLNDLSKFRARLSQMNNVFFSMSVFDVIMLGRIPHYYTIPSAKDRNIVYEVIDFFNIRHLVNEHYDYLSGGEKQLIHLARVLVQIWNRVSNYPYRILLLDEPLTFLDIYYQYYLMNKIKEFILINKDVYFIGIIHDLTIVYEFAEYVYFMKEGSITISGDINTVFTKQNIKKIFDIELKWIQ